VMAAKREPKPAGLPGAEFSFAMGQG
jgi:hypothetical protein